MAHIDLPELTIGDYEAWLGLSLAGVVVELQDLESGNQYPGIRGELREVQGRYTALAHASWALGQFREAFR
jgi:hypothetical protein